MMSVSSLIAPATIATSAAIAAIAPSAIPPITVSDRISASAPVTSAASPAHALTTDAMSPMIWTTPRRPSIHDCAVSAHELPPRYALVE